MKTSQLLDRSSARTRSLHYAIIIGSLVVVICLNGGMAHVWLFIGLVAAFIYCVMKALTDLLTGIFCLSARYGGSGAGHVFAWVRRIGRRCKLRA
jgi:hypothetical protein